MNVTKIALDGILLIEPKIYSDDRGFFLENYEKNRYKSIGIKEEFVQDNHSLSLSVGTIRGLHFQAPPHAQGKLVRCGRGAIFDVAVDIRVGSQTYGEWVGYELSADNGYQLYIPVGFAHGFLTLQNNSEIVYKCTDYYAPETEGMLLWNDSSIDINWPFKGNPILSDKDASASPLAGFASPFIFGENS